MSDLKRNEVLSFDDGLLTVKVEGHGRANGWGVLAFHERQIEVDADGYHSVEIPPSELRELHAFLGRVLALSAAPGEPCAVKPLEWRDHSFKDYEEHIASWGDYHVTKDETCDWPYILRPFIAGQSNFQTLDAAKAAAQADYEQRIRSALVPTPQPAAGWDELPAIPDEDADFTPDLARKIIAKYQQIITSLRREAPAPAEGEKQQSDEAFDIEELRRENADNVRVLDAIADFVGCPHDEELTVDHVRAHYAKLEDAAQRQGVADGNRIAALESARPDTAEALPRWRHKKRGTIYTEIGRGFAQVSHHPIEEMTAVVIYRATDGRLWVRNAVEFDDGRFEALSPGGDEAKESEGGKRRFIDDHHETAEWLRQQIKPSSSADRRGIVARVIEPLPWARKDNGCPHNLDAATIHQSLVKADAILAALDGGR